MTVPQLLRRTTSTGQSALLLLLPHGGQNLARRNAWTSVAEGVDRAQARDEAAAALTAAAHREDRIARHA